MSGVSFADDGQFVLCISRYAHKAQSAVGLVFERHSVKQATAAAAAGGGGGGFAATKPFLSGIGLAAAKSPGKPPVAPV